MTPKVRSICKRLIAELKERYDIEGDELEEITELVNDAIERICEELEE